RDPFPSSCLVVARRRLSDGVHRRGAAAPGPAPSQPGVVEQQVQVESARAAHPLIEDGAVLVAQVCPGALRHLEYGSAGLAHRLPRFFGGGISRRAIGNRPSATGVSGTVSSSARRAGSLLRRTTFSAASSMRWVMSRLERVTIACSSRM